MFCGHWEGGAKRPESSTIFFCRVWFPFSCYFDHSHNSNAFYPAKLSKKAREFCKKKTHHHRKQNENMNNPSADDIVESEATGMVRKPNIFSILSANIKKINCSFSHPAVILQLFLKEHFFWNFFLVCYS